MKYEYLNLAIGAPRRLAILRRDFDQWFIKNPHAPRDRVKSWRDVRFANLRSTVSLGQGTNDGKPIWYTQAGQFFRHEQWCDEVVSIDHTGWYADKHFDEKVRGIVAKLSHYRWLAGYWMSVNDERVYFPTIYDTPEDAARAADEEARVVAESEREYSERYYEARNLEDEIEQLEDRIRELIILRNHLPYARVELPEKIEQLREKREKLATDYKGVL
jgi:hypothetical protein